MGSCSPGRSVQRFIVSGGSSELPRPLGLSYEDSRAKGVRRTVVLGGWLLWILLLGHPGAWRVGAQMQPGLLFHLILLDTKKSC